MDILLILQTEHLIPEYACFNSVSTSWLIKCHTLSFPRIYFSPLILFFNLSKPVILNQEWFFLLRTCGNVWRHFNLLGRLHAIAASVNEGRNVAKHSMIYRETLINKKYLVPNVDSAAIKNSDLNYNGKELWLSSNKRDWHHEILVSPCGSAVTNPTSNHENVDSIPGLAQSVKAPALLWAVV